MKILVFGSNREGRHGKGAAHNAWQLWGAQYGQAEGLQGRSYGIVTKELRHGYPKVELPAIKIGVEKFIRFAEEHPQHTFIVTPIGCGLAGFKHEQIGPMFKNAPKNCVIPKEFIPYVNI